MTGKRKQEPFVTDIALSTKHEFSAKTGNKPYFIDKHKKNYKTLCFISVGHTSGKAYLRYHLGPFDHEREGPFRHKKEAIGSS